MTKSNTDSRYYVHVFTQMYLFPCYYSAEVSARMSEAGVRRIALTQVSSIQSTQHTVALCDRDLVRLEGYHYWLPWQCWKTNSIFVHLYGYF